MCACSCAFCKGGKTAGRLVRQLGCVIGASQMTYCSLIVSMPTRASLGHPVVRVSTSFGPSCSKNLLMHGAMLNTCGARICSGSVHECIHLGLSIAAQCWCGGQAGHKEDAALQGTSCGRWLAQCSLPPLAAAASRVTRLGQLSGDRRKKKKVMGWGHGMRPTAA